MSLTIHCKYKYFDSTVQRAEDRRQKFYFCRLPFAVNVKLNLSIPGEHARVTRVGDARVVSLLNSFPRRLVTICRSYVFRRKKSS